jgi:hypothetical protein
MKSVSYVSSVTPTLGCRVARWAACHPRFMTFALRGFRIVRSVIKRFTEATWTGISCDETAARSSHLASTDGTNAPPAESPVPAPEAQLTGFLELGYRWRTDVAGSLNSYRSVIDLVSGLKLLRTEFSFEDPKRRLFDRFDVRAYNWGDDPYSTLHMTARKDRLYDFSADYRNIAYFNFLPSFANRS